MSSQHVFNFGLGILTLWQLEMGVSALSFLDNFSDITDYDLTIFVGTKVPFFWKPSAIITPRKIVAGDSIKFIASSEAPNCNDLDVPRTPIVLDKRPKVLMLLPSNVSDVENFLETLQKSMTSCPDEVRPGLYHPNNIILMDITNTAVSTEQSVQEIFWSSGYIRSHKNAAIIKSNTLLTYNVQKYSLYENSPSGFMWPHVMNTKLLKNMFADKDMKGHTLKVSSVPYAYFVTGDYDFTSADPRKMFNNWSGSEVMALEAICQKLNCQTSYSNPEHLVWGTFVNGSGTGMYKDIIENEIDIILGEAASYALNRAVEQVGIVIMESYLTVASKAPEALETPLYLVFPFSGFVWAVIAVQMLIIPLVFTLIARFEYQLGRDGSRYWTELNASAWYCLATLLGESITTKLDMRKAWAIRIVSIFWLMFALVVTSAYGGNLRAYLLKPKTHPAVETFSDIVGSGLPWSMVLWGDNLVVSLSTHEDPDIKAFWEDIKIEEYSNFPYETLKRVYEGQELHVDYHAMLDLVVQAGFTYSSASSKGSKSGIHLSKNLLPWRSNTFYSSWSMARLKPWISDIEQLLQMSYDTGLRLKWMNMARQNEITKYRPMVEPLKVPYQDPHVSKMSQEYGMFMLYGIFAALSVVTFCFEACQTFKGKEKLTVYNQQRLIIQ